MLPFLKASKWPRIAKISGESKYGFSDQDLDMEEAAKELMQGLANKDYSLIMQGIEALVQIIKSKHLGAEDDADARENA